MNTHPTTMVPPRTAFMSALRRELVMYWPRPGQAKTVSVRTAPPTRVGSDRPTTVTTGMRAFRRA